MTSSSAVQGRFGLADNYPHHLRKVLDAHEQGAHLGHIQRTLIVQGDVRETVPRYREENPHTIVALPTSILTCTSQPVTRSRPSVRISPRAACWPSTNSPTPSGPARRLRCEKRSAPITATCGRCLAVPHPSTCGGAGRQDQATVPASTSSASRLARMNSFSAVGFTSIAARSSPRRSTRSSS